MTEKGTYRRNPVLPGFHPDPSVCRVGDTFYLATSSFHLFPGIPLRRSRNLADWELAGYAISRTSQIDLSGTPPSRGLFAPTIRHDGRSFYVACTQVDGLGNFLVSAPSIEGPWSDPVPLAVGGIDPSLFFDPEGRTWLCSNGETGDGPGIYLSRIDPRTGRILEGPRLICRGSGGRWPEGPHLYRRGARWHLLLSEGGTEYGHFLTVFRAESPWGPWEACPGNPILTHRDDAAHPVQCVGHGDLVEDANGAWWLLCLGIRTLRPDVLLHNLGRETFLAPVRWNSEGWPVIGENGRIPLELTSLPSLDAESEDPRTTGWEDDFYGPELSPEWISLRSRPEGTVAIRPEGGLVLSGGPVGLSDPGGSPAFIGRPQTSFECIFEAELDFAPKDENSEAGIVTMYDEEYHYEAFVTLRRGSRALVLRRRVHDLELESSPVPLPSVGAIRLTLRADRTRYSFSGFPAGTKSAPPSAAGSGLVAGLCTEGTRRMTFTGVHLGLYCKNGVSTFLSARSMDASGPA